jgi:hypothetical protein
MKKTIAVLALLVSTASYGQGSQQALQHKLDQYTDRFEPEQVDVHLDKQLYFTGDRLWYAIYLNSVPRAESSLSSIVYFEIRSREDSVILRHKIRCKNGFGHGDLLLARQFPTGTYKIAVYTLWMRNAGAVFTRPLSIINLEAAPVEFSNPPPRTMNISRQDARSLSFDVSSAGSVFVSDQQTILFFEKSDDNGRNQLDADISQGVGSWIYLWALDHQGNVKDSRAVPRSSERCRISLRTARKTVGPRDRNEVFLELVDKEGRPISATLSVSVFAKSAEIYGRSGEMEVPNFLGNLDTTMNSREAFIHPVSRQSLDPVLFSARHLIPEGLPIDSARLRVLLNDIGMKKKVMRSFNIMPDLRPEPNYLLPSNNSYFPRDYSSLSTLPEFIREVVPTVRIRKTKSGRKLHVRNSDNPSNIFVFKEPALLLVDGMVIDDAEKALSLPLNDVESVNVIWGINEINRSGLFSLADHGVISIQTRSRTAFAGLPADLFKGLQQPLEFGMPVPAKDDQRPFFTDVLYWNPETKIIGKHRIGLRASDDLGTWVVEVKGITESGDPFYATTEFTVMQENP